MSGALTGFVERLCMVSPHSATEVVSPSQAEVVPPLPMVTVSTLWWLGLGEPVLLDRTSSGSHNHYRLILSGTA
jgi:hypothetical protein